MAEIVIDAHSSHALVDQVAHEVQSGLKHASHYHGRPVSLSFRGIRRSSVSGILHLEILRYPDLCKGSLAQSAALLYFSNMSAGYPGFLQIWSSSLADYWSRPVLRTRSCIFFLLAAVLSICIARACIQLTGTQIYSHDAFALLDGAWRMLNGQRPHTDFYTGLGILAYLPTLVGLLISHGQAGGFGAGQAVMGLLLSMWMFLLTRRRIADVPTVLITLAVVLMATAPFDQGGLPMLMSPDTTYNRYGYAIVSLVLLEAFCPGNSSLDIVYGFSTGVALTLLFFLKISFFLGAIVILAGLFLCRSQSRMRWLGIVLGLLATVLTFAAYLNFTLRPMMQDLKLVAGAKHLDIRWYLVDQTFASAATIVAFALLAAQITKTRLTYIPLAAAATVAAGTFLLITSHQLSGFPLCAPLVVLIVDRVIRSTSASAPQAILVAWGSVMILGGIASDAIGLGAILLQDAWVAGPHWQAKHRERFASRTLDGFLPIGNDLPYLDFVNDGLALANRYRTADDTIMSLDFSNPFSYALQMKPARGGATSLQFGVSFDELHKPSPAWLVGNFRLLMLPKAASESGLEVDVMRLYGPFIVSHFHLVGESLKWRIYRANHT